VRGWRLRPRGWRLRLRLQRWGMGIDGGLGIS
jgi:hypothetical protein